MAESQETKKKINVNIKTPKDKQTVEIEEDASIKDVSDIISRFNAFFFHVVIARKFTLNFN